MIRTRSAVSLCLTQSTYNDTMPVSLFDADVQAVLGAAKRTAGQTNGPFPSTPEWRDQWSLPGSCQGSGLALSENDERSNGIGQADRTLSPDDRRTTLDGRLGVARAVVRHRSRSDSPGQS